MTAGSSVGRIVRFALVATLLVALGVDATAHVEPPSAAPTYTITKVSLPSGGKLRLTGQRATREGFHLHRDFGRNLCLMASFPRRQTTEQCSPVPGKRELLRLRMFGYFCRDDDEDGFSIAIGTAGRRVARVTVEFADDRTARARFHAAPPELGVKKRVFLTVRRYGYDVRRLFAYDSDGTRIKKVKNPFYDPDGPGSACPRPDEAAQRRS